MEQASRCSRSLGPLFCPPSRPDRIVCTVLHVALRRRVEGMILAGSNRTCAVADWKRQGWSRPARGSSAPPTVVGASSHLGFGDASVSGAAHTWQRAESRNDSKSEPKTGRQPRQICGHTAAHRSPDVLGVCVCAHGAGLSGSLGCWRRCARPICADATPTTRHQHVACASAQRAQWADGSTAQVMRLCQAAGAGQVVSQLPSAREVAILARLS